MKKTFKGIMTDSTQQKLFISGGDPKMGYKITKFQVIPNSDENVESTMKIYKNEQSSITETIDFSEDAILAALFFSQHTTSGAYPEDTTVIFDNEVINQDLFITLKGHNYQAPLNYYIELEEVKMSEAEQAVVNFSAILLNKN